MELACTSLAIFHLIYCRKVSMSPPTGKVYMCHLLAKPGTTAFLFSFFFLIAAVPLLCVHFVCVSVKLYL